MDQIGRSGCPINLAVETLGDRWSLLILRDMIFRGSRHYRELLRSEEGISSNILAERLKSLVEKGLLTRRGDPTHKQKAIYSLTEMAIELLPVLANLGIWGLKWLPASERMSVGAKALEEGGPALWARFMKDLRAEHLGHPAVPGPTVRDEMRIVYDEVVAREAAAR